MTQESRRHPRQRVHLRVAFPNAREFVAQYAENLSAGGVFVAGSYGLRLQQEVELEIELPGHGPLAVVATVAHLVRHDEATSSRKAGVGFEIRGGSPGFKEALESYLARLGRRAGMIALVSQEPWRSLVSEAGYEVWPLPHAQGLVTVLASCQAPIAGFIVPATHQALYASALSFLGLDSSLVIPVETGDDADLVLALLDAVLP